MVYKFAYNALGMTVRRHSAADTTIADTLKYDLAGQLRKVKTRRGDEISMTYDKAGRLRTRSGPDFPTDNFVYDSLLGRWQVAYNSVARDSVHFDSRGRVDVWTQTLNGRTYTGTYTYDGIDRITRRALQWTSPALDSAVMKYVYNANTPGRDSLCAFGGKSCVKFKRKGDMVADTLVFNRGTANAWKLIQGYDAAHRITSQDYAQGSGLAPFDLTTIYDSIGRVVNRTSPKSGYTRRVFTYDQLGRLTNACDSTGSQCQNVVNGQNGVSAWSCDSAGNRDQVGVTEVYGPGNRIQSYGGTNFAYDSMGSILCGTGAANCGAGGAGGQKYTWDALGRLKMVKTDGNVFVDSMAYDAMGRRVRKTTGSGTEYYVYEGDQVIVDLNSSGQTLREYAWHPGTVDRLFAMRATSYAGVVDTLAAILDVQTGTVRGLARFRNWTKVKEYDEAPWGDIGADTGVVMRYRFAGRELDSESGLYYMRARYYNPATGRWLSEDPIGIQGGDNLYAYAGSDPVNRTDPSGLRMDCFVSMSLDSVHVNRETGQVVTRFWTRTIDCWSFRDGPPGVAVGPAQPGCVDTGTGTLCNRRTEYKETETVDEKVESPECEIAGWNAGLSGARDLLFLIGARRTGGSIGTALAQANRYNALARRAAIASLPQSIGATAASVALGTVTADRPIQGVPLAGTISRLGDELKACGYR